MPNQPKTPVQRFRLDGDLWEQFDQAVHSADPDADRSKVLRQFVAWFVREPGVRLPARPAAQSARTAGNQAWQPDPG
jgi:hypothetical protein